ncbi:phosphoribosylformylglycinamidine synthase subunit PurQ [Candidatus Bipolaricaulota bacterium]|nr:phosphoribosylformylglycinamidine synthase subunit PurQ [Candidatus Bipolaricaulota bacterium]
MKKIAVLSGYGINCNEETALAFELAARKLGEEERVATHQVHVNDLIRGQQELSDFSMLTIPGGFLHGDDISAGKILASKLRTTLDRDIREFVGRGKPVMGICNGFQVLVKYPLIPDIAEAQKYTLTENRTGRFIDRWVTVKVKEKSCSVFLRGIDRLNLPIRHAEGRFLADKKDLSGLDEYGGVALQYAKKDGNLARGEFPANPNGSELDIAGICDPSGRIFGLMPHPEAFVHPFQEPGWIKKRRIGEIESDGAGLKIFKNVVEFLVEEDIG